VIGELVAYALGEQKALDELSLEELRRFSPAFSQDVYEAIAPETCVKARNIIGGPAPEQVIRAIEAGEKLLNNKSGE
jgi:argininosuccinate lyase